MQTSKTKKAQFTSFKTYLAHLEKVLAQVPKAEKKFLSLVGEAVEKTAKEKFGHYQEGIGPFKPWAELADSTKDDRVRKGFSANEPLLRDGATRDSISHKVIFGGNIKEVEIGSTSEIMIWLELGVQQNNLPPRPVLGPAMYERKAYIIALGGEILHALMTDQLSKLK